MINFWYYIALSFYSRVINPYFNTRRLASVDLHVEFYETYPQRTKQRQAGEHRISGQITLRKTSVAAAFLFPGNLSVEFIRRACRAKGWQERPIALDLESEWERAIALSLIFSDWLAGLPIWPITGELRGTANRNYMVGATIEFARKRDRSSKMRCVSSSLSFSPSPSFSLSRRSWFWIRSMPLGLGSNK